MFALSFTPSLFNTNIPCAAKILTTCSSSVRLPLKLGWYGGSGSYYTAIRHALN